MPGLDRLPAQRRMDLPGNEPYVVQNPLAEDVRRWGEVGAGRDTRKEIWTSLRRPRRTHHRRLHLGAHGEVSQSRLWRRNAHAAADVAGEQSESQSRSAHGQLTTRRK